MDAAEYREEMETCRARLAKQMGLEEVPDDVWGHVEKLGLVSDAIFRGDDESWRELLEAAKDRRKKSLEATGQNIPPGRGTSGEGGRAIPSEVAVELSEDTRRRAEAFAEVAANMAHAHPNVLRFRRRFMPEGLLKDAEARRFLDIRVKPYTELNETSGGVRREMLKLAKMLNETYRWPEEDAMWFALTGQAPQVKPLQVTVFVNNAPKLPKRGWWGGGFNPRGSHPSTARITVSADVSVDAGEVTRAFRDVQRQILGGNARPSRKPRTLEIVRFVARRMREHPEETWNERLRAWNDAYPKWRYKNFRALRQAFERFAYKQYSLPKYDLPYRWENDQWGVEIRLSRVQQPCSNPDSQRRTPTRT